MRRVPQRAGETRILRQRVSYKLPSRVGRLCSGLLRARCVVMLADHRVREALALRSLTALGRQSGGAARPHRQQL
eukprot:2307481-Prymnesium_polylepis.1